MASLQSVVEKFGFWEAVRRRARYGHRDWIVCVWRSRDKAAWPCDADSAGCARLCVREGGTAYLVSANSGIMSALNEATADILRRNAANGY
jgi:hypothetical protein